MKKTFLLIQLLSLAFWANAQHQIIVQNAQGSQLFASIDSAFAHVQDGDTVYLPAQTYVPHQKTLTISNRVHVIGAGYYRGLTDSVATTVIDATIYLLDGADHSTFEGFELINTLYLGKTTSQEADVDNLSFKRCLFRQTLYLGKDGEAQYLSFKECVFISWVEARNASYLSFSNCFFESQLRYTNGNTLVDHCIIDGQFNYNKNLTITNSILETGGTIGGTNTGYILYNCVFHEINPAEYFKNNPNQAINCFGPVTWIDMFVDSPVDVYTNAYNPHHDYRLKAGAIGKGAATDGSDIGLYGGSMPFKMDRKPSNPQVTKAEVATATDNNGVLKVKFTVKAQQD